MSRLWIWLLSYGIIALLIAQAAKAGSTNKGAEHMALDKPKIKQAFFAAGCFWKVQYVFSKVPGIVRTRAGYCGGTLKDPTYEQVCTDKTGHAETVLVEYDPAKVTYRKLLETFFANHDPTTLNRQGPDVGSQYRSVIFYTTQAERDEALKYKLELSQAHRFKAPISTSIEPAGAFFAAEDYHQDYYAKHGARCF